MKIAVSLYSFGGYVNPDSLGIFGCMDKAKEMGFDGIEITQGDLVRSGADIHEVAEYAKKIGLPIVAYLFGKDFLRNKGTTVEEEIRSAMEYIDRAAILGAPLVRHDITHCDLGRKHGIGLECVIHILADACRRVTEYAAERGIKTSFENHGHFMQEAALVERMINAVDHDNFGLTLDMGNFLCADEDPGYSVGKLARYAFHVHAKDFHVKPGGADFPGEGWFRSRGNNFLRGAVIGHGDANVARSVGALKMHGYDGWVSVEFEGIEDNLKGIRLGKANLERYIGE